MTSPHLSERALQDAAESASLLSPSQVAHLRGCLLCQGQVTTYQHLLTAVAHLPQPAFAFDLTASILAQLPRAKPAFPWVLSVMSALILAVVTVFLVLFGSLLVPFFQSLYTGLGVGLVIVGVFVLVGQCMELLAQHRRQMRELAFS